MSKLAVSELQVVYRRLVALSGATFSVRAGERVFISGPNGAGKSSLLKAVSGIVHAANGRVELDGEIISGQSPDAVARKGVSMVPEGREIFCSLTVKENLMVGAGMRRDREAIGNDLESVYDAFPLLRDRQSSNAGTLSGGQQQMLAIGRALMTNPKLMLVDEPSLGLAPKIVDQVYETLVALQVERGLTLVIVEQSAVRAARVGGRMLLLQNGRIVGDGDAQAFCQQDKVAEAYFGASNHGHEK
ncbi:ABC transporter ATP-binding protein (plasmid) [Aminobacter sp. SR38]|jgi:branched-chain amino acid transport system ATP-binding protein|uniref:ABC transporter ATP-binding protein n=1 Tax=Aminobacter sp. SR38 TaxID=2774562 RepID=UPI00177CA856|nr:ABC transporter ATP-binding protein [Aminobacter sp. SR38]QOF75497.1 ABC transporter ATP-binding protein [Aminobacter sp. SR38]